MDIPFSVVPAFLTGVAATYMKLSGHFDSHRKASRDRMQRLYDLTSEELDKVPALAIQIAVHDAFGRAMDEAWIRLIWRQQNPLPLLQDCARTSHLLRMSEDGTRIEDRTVLKGQQYSRWSWLAVVFASIFFIYTVFLGALELDHNILGTVALISAGLASAFMLFSLASMFDAADRLIKRFAVTQRSACDPTME